MVTWYKKKTSDEFHGIRKYKMLEHNMNYEDRNFHSEKFSTPVQARQRNEWQLMHLCNKGSGDENCFKIPVVKSEEKKTTWKT
jgi:hypothetical protein